MAFFLGHSGLDGGCGAQRVGRMVVVDEEGRTTAW